MFPVGRYDPRDHDAQVVQEKGTGSSRSAPRSNRKRQRRSGKAVSRRPPEKDRLLSSTDGRAQENVAEHKREEKTEADHESSDSGGVSSSSESDDTNEQEMESKQAGQSTLHVIAPEATGSVRKKRPLELNDEAFDDFDVDELLNGNVDKGDSSSQQDDDSDLPDEIKTALHMSSLPIEKAARAWDLAPFLIANLKRDGYEHFFPIQSLVIPDVITSERHAHIRARDVCVAAPTGSGKTLAYVLPVLNALSKRVVRRLRALVVLPSRDLALQVYDVFERYTHGSDLRVGLAIGQSDFEAEQKALLVGPVDASTMEGLDTIRYRHFLQPGDLDLALEAFSGVLDANVPTQDGAMRIPDGGISAVDVLVATPGRLVDHLDRTPGFTLQHLRFLVIDEYDRLINQSYHNWIGRVVASSNDASVEAWHKISSGDGLDAFTSLRLAPDGNSFENDPITWRRGDTADHDTALGGSGTSNSVVASVCRPAQLRKLLFSATLTKDPQKLASLGLVNPKHFDAHHLRSQRGVTQQRYKMPEALSEFTVECTAEQKPLILLALLLDQLQQKGSPSSIVVVFTSSLDSTHRLARLLQLLWGSIGCGDPMSVAEFSSALNQKKRSTLMKRCSNGDVSVVVCSDGMSRGMDIPSVSAVINYDVPSFAKTYVHRCGRTARAGKSGRAISVLKGGQVRQFQRMRKLIDDPGRVKGMPIKKELVRDSVAQYRHCVKALGEVIQAEHDGDLSPTDAIPPSFVRLG